MSLSHQEPPDEGTGTRSLPAGEEMVVREATAGPRPRAETGVIPPAKLVIWFVWVGMTLAALVYVARYGSDVPSWDDWDMVPILTGHQPVTWDWLWSQHNEHRVPVPRLLLLGLAAVFGIDFRTGMYVNAVAASLLAAATMLTISRLRGRSILTDAVIPILLLNLGQGLNFIWGWQVEFFASTAFASAALLIVALWGNRPTVWVALAMGSCIVLLAGTGAHGVALIPALASWLAMAGMLRWHEATGKPTDDRSSRTLRLDAVILLAVAVLGLLLTACYFIGYERVPYHPTSPGRRASVITSLKFLSMSFGPAARAAWPFSGFLVLVLTLGAGIVLLHRVNPLRAKGARRRVVELYRALGLLCFLGAMASLAVGIGLGRDGFEPRYITLSIPVLLAVYMVLTIYSPGRPGAAARWGMLAAACLALWPNTRFGLNYGRELRGHLAAFERDLIAGVPPHRLIHDFGNWLHPHPDILADYLPMLREASVGPYRQLADDPVFEEQPVPLVPVVMNQSRWDPATATMHASGNYPYVTFQLAGPRRVAGIRLRYTHSKPGDSAPYVSIYWKHGEQEFHPERYSKYSPTGDRANWERGTYMRIGDDEATMTVWILDRIDSIRLHPDFDSCSFKIHELTLLIAPDH